MHRSSGCYYSVLFSVFTANPASTGGRGLTSAVVDSEPSATPSSSEPFILAAAEIEDNADEAALAQVEATDAADQISSANAACTTTGRSSRQRCSRQASATSCSSAGCHSPSSLPRSLRHRRYVCPAAPRCRVFIPTWLPASLRPRSWSRPLSAATLCLPTSRWSAFLPGSSSASARRYFSKQATTTASSFPPTILKWDSTSKLCLVQK